MPSPKYFYIHKYFKVLSQINTGANCVILLFSQGPQALKNLSPEDNIPIERNKHGNLEKSNVGRMEVKVVHKLVNRSLYDEETDAEPFPIALTRNKNNIPLSGINHFQGN